MIAHKRSKEKNKTKYFLLSSQFSFAITVISAFELLRGDNSPEDKFWKDFFARVVILDLDIECAEIAGNIYRDLKQKGKMIGVEDILIASVAIKHKLKVVSDNTKHFERIDGLQII